MFNQDKMAQAIQCITDYNSKVAETLHFPTVDLEQKLHKFGSTDDEDLREMMWEEWQAIGLPPRLAKKVARIFRGSAAETIAPQVMQLRTASEEVSELSHRDLIIRFAANPSILHGAVAKQIRARSGNRPCIGFEKDGTTINVDASVLALESYVEGDDVGDFIRVKDQNIYLYHVGECQGGIRDEHPLFPGQTLKKDGTDKRSIPWTTINFEVRQLLRLARTETQELRIKDQDDLFDKYDLGLRGMSVVQTRYPKAARLFEERKDLGGLPPLKSRVGNRKKTEMTNN